VVAGGSNIEFVLKICMHMRSKVVSAFQILSKKIMSMKQSLTNSKNVNLYQIWNQILQYLKMFL